MDKAKYEFIDFWNLPHIKMTTPYTLLSDTGDMFHIPREAAMLSKVLCGTFNLYCTDMEDGEVLEGIPQSQLLSEAQHNSVQFRTISGPLLHLVVKYMYYKLQCEWCEQAPDSFGDQIPKHLVQDLTLVAKFLEI